MDKPIWDGRGELDMDAMVCWSTRDGVLRGLPYLRQRVRARLRPWVMPGVYTQAQIDRAVRETVGWEPWLRPRNGMLVEAVARDAERYLLDNGWEWV
jgi:hypothetical protein